LRGPELAVDSSGTQPRLDTLEDFYVVRLPSDMARVLNDSVPGFTPLSQTTYPLQFAGLHRAPLSVVLGDFNGDSARDIAMLGKSEGSSAFIIVLAKSAKIPEPRLLSVLRPLPPTRGDLPTYLERVSPQTFTPRADPRIHLDLRADAVRAYRDSGSTIYYLKDGKVRELSVGG
jgi:hypothetical protein